MRRFVLAVAADVKSRQRRIEIEREHARFTAVGVEFEVWAPRQLQEKLRPYHGITTQYLGEAIADQICGKRQPAVTQPTLDQVVVSQLSNVQAALAAELDQRLDTALSELKRGNGASIDRAVDQIQGDDVRWATLPPEAKARVLRLRAARELEQGSVERAEQLADEADRMAGQARGRRLRATIAARRGQAELGLQILGAPESPDDCRLQAALLLAKGELCEALDALASASGAEDEALRSLILAKQGRTKDALAAVERAEQLGPDLLAVRRAGIMVRYAAALSPIAPFDAGSWPDPVPLGLVREDDFAQQCLQMAGNIADVTLRQPGLDRNDRHDLQTWRLACLANQRTRSPEAEAYARDVLAGGRPHAGAVAWSLARGFDFDRHRVARSLVDRLESGHGEPPHLTVLLALELDQNRPERAKRALDRHGHQFAEGPAAELLSNWKAIISARMQEAVPPAAPLPLRLQQLVEEAEASGNWQAVVALVHEVAEGSASNGLALAYHGIHTLAAAGEWEQVGPFIPFLVERVATAEAVTLACLAAHETGDPEGVLSLLDAHADLFPNGTPPLRLRRLRVSCLRSLGRLPEAARLADGLVSVGGLPDLFAAIDVRLAAGDLRGAVPYFRIAAERDDLPSEAALRYARMTRAVDPIVASELWRKAQSTGLPQHLAALAATTAFELGLDLEAGPSIAGVAAQAEAGDRSLRLVGHDELIQFLRERQTRAEQSEAKYLSGEIPAHVAFNSVGGILADIFARAFTGRSGPLLIRDGSRRLDATFESPAASWRLRLDITAILIAHHLDLLDLLEQRLAPIQLPFILPAALREMALCLRPVQPAQVRAQRSLISAIDEGRVARVVLNSRPDAAGAMVDGGGLLVDYTPAPDQIAHERSIPFVNPRRVVDALATSGAGPPEVIERGRRALGSMAEELAIGPEPKPGQKLVFSGNTLEAFSAAGLLEALIAAFQVVADSEWIQIARNELAEAQRREEVAVDLDRLGDRIALGIARGTYRVLPAPLTAPGDEQEDAERPVGPDLRCLVDLIRSRPEPGQVIWIDDRHVTRFQRVDNIPLLGVFEVLSSLKAAGFLGNDAYFDRLRRLRDAGAQFIPLSAEEVLYYVDRAPLQGGALADTPGLRSLRRSLAAAALLEEHLRLVPGDDRFEGRTDETLVLHDLWRCSAVVLGALWQRGGADVDRTRACADWVYENLAVDRLKRAPLDGTETSRRRLHALGLANFAWSAIWITGPNEAAELSRRQAYYAWLGERVFEPVLKADPELTPEVVALLKDFLLGMLDDEREWTEAPEPRDAARVFLARLVVLLPEGVRVPLLEMPGVLEKLRLEHQPTVELDRSAFAADTFFAAAQKAIDAGSAELDAKGGYTFHLERTSADAPVLRFSGPASGHLADPALDLLSDDPEARRACLARHPEWIDRPLRDRELKRAGIIAIPAPHERMLALDDERTASAEFQYRRLAEALARRARVPAPLFEPPSAEALVRYLRLDDEIAVPFSHLVERAALRLVDEGGPALAAARLAGLPVDTPPAINRSLDAMGRGDRARTIKGFDGSAASPLRRARAIELLRALGAEQDRLVTSLDRLLGDLEGPCEALIAVLTWTERVLERQHQWRELSRPIRLATVWGHAERVTDILLASGAPPAQIKSTFNGWHPRVLAPWLLRDPADSAEPADPAALSPDAIAFRFLGMALGDQAEALLSEEHRRRLRICISETAGEGETWPRLSLLAPAPGPDALGSFLANDFPRLRAALDQGGLGDRLSPHFASSIADHAIGLLAQEPEDIGAWTSLLAARRHRTAPEERDRVVDLLRQLDLRGISGADDRIGLAVAVWAADISRLLRSTEVDRAVEDQIIALSSVSVGRSGVAARAYDDADPELHSAALVGDAAIRLCRTPEAQVAAERLASIVPKLVANCPIAAPLWRQALEQIVRELPFSATAPLWRVVLQLRARSDV